jgi:hypothetical protein
MYLKTLQQRSSSALHLSQHANECKDASYFHLGRLPPRLLFFDDMSYPHLPGPRLVTVCLLPFAQDNFCLAMAQARSLCTLLRLILHAQHSLSATPINPPHACTDCQVTHPSYLAILPFISLSMPSPWGIAFPMMAPFLYCLHQCWVIF